MKKESKLNKKLTFKNISLEVRDGKIMIVEYDKKEGHVVGEFDFLEELEFILEDNNEGIDITISKAIEIEE